MKLGARLRQAVRSGFGFRAQSAFEGATTGRRLGTWGLGSIGPNAAVIGNLPNLRSRSREQNRNNPWAVKGLDSYVANFIGTGIVPKWVNVKERERRRTIHESFKYWTDEADADGRTDFYGLQDLSERTRGNSGATLVRMRTRRLTDGLVVPLQLQVLEPDFLDDSIDRPTDSGGYVRMGIEFNALGQRTAYHLHATHPGDIVPMSGFGGAQTIRVPAEDIVHVYFGDRPGLLNGVPSSTSILLKLYDIDQTSDARVMLQKVATLMAGFLHQAPPAGGTFPGIDKGKEATNNQQQLGWEPGSLSVLPPGVDKIEWSEPPSTADYPEFMRTELRAVAAGMGVTYEQLTGDLSGVNFSSIRTGMLDFRARIEARLWHMFVFQFCRPIVRRWVELGVAAGTLPIGAEEYLAGPRPFYTVDWRTPKRPWVDPLKDLLAEKEAVRCGFKALSDVVAEQGDDIEDLFERIAADRALAKQYGLVFATDVGQTNDSGAIQVASDDGDPDAADARTSGVA